MPESAYTPATESGESVREALRRLRATSNLEGYRIVVEAFGLCGHPAGHDGKHRTGTAGWLGWPCAEVVTPPAAETCPRCTVRVEDVADHWSRHHVGPFPGISSSPGEGS